MTSESSINTKVFLVFIFAALVIFLIANVLYSDSFGSNVLRSDSIDLHAKVGKFDEDNAILRGICGNGMTLRETWLSYDERPFFNRWLEYADHYETFLPSASRMHRKIRMLQIGVQSGGSARAWKKCYGDMLEYVGIDIDPRCLRSDSPTENIRIRIGSQLNTSFLTEICSQFGPFDVVIDDGGHTAGMIETSLAAIFPSDVCMGEHSVYAVEDTHTMARCDAKGKYCKSAKEISFLPCQANEKMHSLWFHKHTDYVWADKVVSVHMFDSLSFYIRGVKRILTKISKGDDSFPSIV